MKVTPEMLVMAIQQDMVVELATNLGWDNPAPASPYYWTKQTKLEAIEYIAGRITFPGALNGTPATFEVVYRAED